MGVFRNEMAHKAPQPFSDLLSSAFQKKVMELFGEQLEVCAHKTSKSCVLQPEPYVVCNQC